MKMNCVSWTAESVVILLIYLRGPLNLIGYWTTHIFLIIIMHHIVNPLHTANYYNNIHTVFMMTNNTKEEYVLISYSVCSHHNYFSFHKELRYSRLASETCIWACLLARHSLCNHLFCVLYNDSVLFQLYLLWWGLSYLL